MSEPVQPPYSRRAPCPCGSGKKYKRCCGVIPKHDIRPKSRRFVWIVGSAIVFVIGGIVMAQQNRTPQSSQDSTQPKTFGFPLFGRSGGGSFGGTNFSQIDGVDMSILNEEQKNEVMRKANSQRCTCGCRMTLAQCINTDSTCPLRGRNFQRARQLVSSTLRGS